MSWNFFCGAGRDRTDDPRLARAVLSQLSYSPITKGRAFSPLPTSQLHLINVGLGRVELPTSRLSGVRSNRS